MPGTHKHLNVVDIAMKSFWMSIFCILLVDAYIQKKVADVQQRALCHLIVRKNSFAACIRERDLRENDVLESGYRRGRKKTN